jgi:hypothetical protein
MASRKSKTRRSRQTPKSTRRKAPVLLIILVCAGLAIVSSVLLYRTFTPEPEPKKAITATDPSKQVEPAAVPESYQIIVGRWIRPDGGYVLDIQGVRRDGQLQAGYFNPRPINVARAQATRAQRELHVFIELRDTGYPGATYTLTYNAENDVLAGIYYQPTANQSFEVIFVRKQ